MIAGAARLADAAYGDEDCEEHPQLRPAGALSWRATGWGGVRSKVSVRLMNCCRRKETRNNWAV